MSNTLTALIGCEFSNGELFDLPRLLNRFSVEPDGEKWGWVDSSPSSEIKAENLEKLVGEGFAWLSGPKNMSVVPHKKYLYIDYGWSFSRFYCEGDKVEAFIKLCGDLARVLQSKKIYFLPDRLSESMSYQEVGLDIIAGKLTEADLGMRLVERHEHDVYTQTT